MPPSHFKLSPVMMEILEASEHLERRTRESIRTIVQPRGKMANEFDKAHRKLWNSGLLEIVPAQGETKSEQPFLYSITELGKQRLEKAKEPA